MRARLLPLLEHGDGHLAEALPHVRVLLEQLAEPDRAGEPARTASDDQHADLDPLVRGIGGCADRVGCAERWQEVDRARH